jgi:hypothetical protein
MMQLREKDHLEVVWVAFVLSLDKIETCNYLK